MERLISFSVLATALLLGACDSEPSVTASAPASAEAALDATASAFEVAPAFLGTPPPPSYGTFSGSVVARTVDGHRVVVSLDSAPSDGLVDRVFSFQTDTALSTPVSFDADDANVTLVHGNLFVEVGARSLQLRTSGFDVGQAVAARSLRGPDLGIATSVELSAPRRTIVGVGLAQQVVEPDAAFALARARDGAEYLSTSESTCATSLPFIDLPGSGSTSKKPDCVNGYCPAGGPGSTDCGAGGCTVSCGSGYHSCCDGVSCKCCRNS